jgi:two-component system nitrogen regulation sensor histidine kinase NtrY
MAIVFGIFLALSFLISRYLVLSFQKLLEQLQVQSSRLEKLSSIESWQKIARVLVHELRAPITPIKLVATDIERKHQMLNPSQFEFYLHEGAKLIQNEIQSIEKLMENFTQFAKLPEVNRTTTSLLQTLHQFVTHYSGYNDGQVSLQLNAIDIEKDNFFLDAGALKHLFFNLLKNAAEANPSIPVKIDFTLKQGDQKTWIQVRNSGNKIPDEIANKIFDLHVSTKKGMDTPNLGIGLTIARKIALDHQGDLYLLSNTEDGVIFELELPHL